MLVRYNKLDRSNKREYSKKLRALCLEFQVQKQYPRNLQERVDKEAALPSRTGLRTKSYAIDAAGAERIACTLKENAYDLTYAQLGEATGFAPSTLCRFFKQTPGWRVVNKSTRPVINEVHKANRLEWAKKHRSDPWRFHVDVDEKWFYVYSHSGKLKLPPGVEKPKQALPSKRFIGKIMMLIAVARPNRAHNFNGKVGCWRVVAPFIYKKATTYNGVRYRAGDERMKDASMDGDMFVKMVTEKLFPAIRAKLPRAATVKVQYDNAPGHLTQGALPQDIAAALPAPTRRGVQIGPKIELVKQAANSPDTNALDLGVNKSLDSRLPKRRSFNLDAFEEQVMQEFDTYPSEKLDDIFDMKNRVCDCIIEAEGDNTFKLPHRKKARI